MTSGWQGRRLEALTLRAEGAGEGCPSAVNLDHAFSEALHSMLTLREKEVEVASSSFNLAPLPLPPAASESGKTLPQCRLNLGKHPLRVSVRLNFQCV